MNSPQMFVFRRLVSQQTLLALSHLLEQMSAQFGQEASLWTEQTLFQDHQDFPDNPSEIDYWRLLISPQLNVLLLGKFIVHQSLYQISLTWDSQTIQDLLTQLAQERTLSQHLPLLTPFSNSWTAVNHFFHLLLDLLVDDSRETPASLSPPTSLYHPIEEALRQQVEQERLLNQVVTQIHQSLDLSQVLKTAVTEVRNFLGVDRLLIYQFKFNSSVTDSTPHSLTRKATITYEARASQLIPSMLHLSPEEDCFVCIPFYQEKYRQGTVVAVENAETEYSSSFCLAELLRQNHVKSLLIAPIIVDEQLWGLIIAHQCFKIRQWLESEKGFLGHIGEHLAIAIQQAQLYQQVQQQKIILKNE